jgi:hypothetical protein
MAVRDLLDLVDALPPHPFGELRYPPLRAAGHHG